MKAEVRLDALWELLIPHMQRALRGGESQEKLAQQVGISQASISHWLKGERRDNVRLVSVLKIVDALGIDPAKVFDVLFAGEERSGIEQLRHERDEALQTLARVRRALEKASAS